MASSGSERGRIRNIRYNLYALLQYGHWFDLITVKSLESGCFDVVYDYCLHYGVLQHIVLIFMILYFLGLFFIVFILSRIWWLLVPLFYLLLSIHSAPDHGWAILALFFLYLLNKWRKRYNYQPIQSPVVPFSMYTNSNYSKPSLWTGQVNVSALLVVLLALGVLLAPPDVSSKLSMVIPLAVVLFGATAIPGVAGNSTMGLLSMVLLFVFGMFLVPEFSRFVGGLSGYMAERSHQLFSDKASGYDPVGDTIGVLRPKAGTGWSFHPDSSSLPNFLRFVFSHSWMYFMLLDDLLGPTHYIKGALATSGRREAEKVLSLKLWSGIFSTRYLIMVAWEILLFIFYPCWVRMCVIFFSMNVAYGEYLLSQRVWRGKGAFCSVSTTNSAVMMDAGEGPMGFRKCLVLLHILASGICLWLEHPVPFVVVCVLVSLTSFVSQRVSIIVLGLYAMSPGMFLSGIFGDRPLTGQVEKAQVPSTECSVGLHSGVPPEPQPRPRKQPVDKGFAEPELPPPPGS